VLRAAGETGTTQENIQNCLKLEYGDPKFWLLTDEKFAAVIFFNLFSSLLPILLNFSLFCFCFNLTFASLIRIIA
jgi:hypothetical protein